jgi:hypothetical protein
MLFFYDQEGQTSPLSNGEKIAGDFVKSQL